MILWRQNRVNGNRNIVIPRERRGGYVAHAVEKAHSMIAVV